MKPKRKPKNNIETIKEKPEQIIVSFEVIKPIEEVKPIIEEVKTIEINKNIKITELVECPDCNKKMTKKSLKYSHEQNCIAHKQPEPIKTIEKKPKQIEVSNYRTCNFKKRNRNYSRQQQSQKVKTNNL